MVRRLGIIEGVYCGGHCNLQPWDTAVNNLKASCNRRSSGPTGSNPDSGFGNDDASDMSLDGNQTGHSSNSEA